MDAKKKAIALTAGVIAAIAMALFVLSGCASQGSGGGDGASADVQRNAQRASYDAASINELMGRLVTAVSVEEANELIGVEGEKTDESVNQFDEDLTHVVYEWNLGEGFSIEGTYTTVGSTGRKSASYETEYDSDEVPGKADFSRWEEVKKELNGSEGLSYERVVELLGGAEGLKEKVETDGYIHCVWYDEDGGYLFAYFNPDGECTLVSGRF